MKKKLDYANKFLYPATVDVTDEGLTIGFGEEKIAFKGRIFSVDSSEKMECKINLTQYLLGQKPRDRIDSNQVTINVECYARKDCVVYDCRYFDGEWENVDAIEVNKTNFSGIGVFIRKGQASFMLSLDFPYSEIKEGNKRVSIGYDPLDNIKAGEIYRPHSLTIGATYLTGERSGRFDRAEVEAFCEYVQSRMPKNFNGSRPIFSSTCITNRMTDVRDGRIFYSMYDNPTLTLDPETLKEEVKLCAELGIEYYQVFEGYYDWEEDGASEKNLKEIVELGNSLGVRVGDYMTALELNCWHYNYYDRRVTDQNLLSLGENGNRYYLCYGNDRTVDMLLETVVESIKRNGEEMICVDGNCAVPCLDVTHGHNAGSFYKHIRGMVRFFEAMNNTSPYFMTWTNAGNWIEFMPKLLWYNQNVYLTDPHPRAYSSSLNNLKYYGDCRREQMVTVHNKYFVPYTAFSNCEYYAFKHSRVDDSEFFEYSFLQGLAVTPNICLGEMRTFFERTSSKRLPYVKAFIKKWLRFVRENIDCWRHVYQLGDCPGAGANEAYAHINGNRGFVCLVNQNASTNTFSFDLDWSIGLKGKNDDRFILSEVYPEERFIAEQSLPGPLYGETITLSVPAHSVRFVKIEPYYEEPSGIRLYGIAGKIKQEEEAYTVQFSAESGACVESAVWLSDRAVADVNVETKKTVRKYYFPSSVTDCKIAGCCARFIVNAPREYFNREINRWHVDNSEESYILSYAGSDFCGGFIHNLYKERQNMILSVGYRKEQTKESLKALPYIYNTVGEKQVPKRRARVYSTKLEIPFIENPTMANGYGYDEVLEFVFRDNLSIKSLRAFIDKKPVKIFEYKYPPNPEMKAFYIELIGEVRSGTSPCLRLEVEWNSETKKRETTYGETKEGAQVIG